MDALTRRLMAHPDNKTKQAMQHDCEQAAAEIAALRKDAERYRWLRDLLAVEDVARLVDEHAQWSWCETDPAESAKTDAAVDKAMRRAGLLVLHNDSR